MEPFRVNVPDAVLSDLNARCKLARWPEEPDHESWDYGANTGYLQELVA